MTSNASPRQMLPYATAIRHLLLGALAIGASLPASLSSGCGTGSTADTWPPPSGFYGCDRTAAAGSCTQYSARRGPRHRCHAGARHAASGWFVTA